MGLMARLRRSALAHPAGPPPTPRHPYGTRASTFLSNAGLVQVFNVNDTDTAEWVSRALGEMTRNL